MGTVRALSDGEKAVGERVAKVRRFAGHSQRELAAMIQVSRSRLANIESGRTPLDIVTGWLVCEQLNVSQLWLAQGVGNAAPFIGVSLGPGFSKRESFLELCDSDTMSQALASRADSERQGRGFLRATDGADETQRKWLDVSERSLGALWRVFIIKYPPEKWIELTIGASGAMSNFFRDWAAKNALLTELPTYEKVGNVKAPMARLMERLKRATAERGKKAELARALDVPMENISRWLSGSVEPSGTATLLLQDWVQKQERK